MLKIIEIKDDHIAFEGNFNGFCDVARELGVLDEMAKFYIDVRREFNSIQAETGMIGIDIEYLLAEKYSRSQKTIHNILYPSTKK